MNTQLINRKKSLEEEAEIYKIMMKIERNTNNKSIINQYLMKVEKELLELFK